MRGNQAMLNSQVFEHVDNPIKEKIGDKDPLDIIYVITDEYWKEWRRKLTSSHKPHIKAGGIGEYSLMFGKSKSYLRKLISRIKRIKQKYPDTYLQEGTRANGFYLHTIKRFRDTWEQVNELKIEVNKRGAIWKQKKIDRYGDKAIL
jgi:hypothetical protein